MAVRTNLLSLSIILDDSTGMYHCGEIDFGIKKDVIKKMLRSYGEDCVKEMILMMAHLQCEIITIWKEEIQERPTAEMEKQDGRKKQTGTESSDAKPRRSELG